MSEQVPMPRPTITVGGPVTEAEIREFMSGTSNQVVGGPTYEQQFGMTSQGPGVIPQPSVAELDVEAARALHTAIQPDGDDPRLADLQAELEKRNREYGQSENEKGALRQSVQDLLAQVKSQQDQFMAMQMMASQAQHQPAQPNFAPNYGRGPRDPFQDRDETDVVSVKDARRMFDEAIVPVLSSFQQQTFAALDQREANNKRMAARLNPMDEQRVLWQNPWIAQIQSDSAKVDAILNAIRGEQLQARVAQAANVPQTVPQGQPQVERTIRQISHTVAPSSTSPEPTADAVQVAYQRDMAQAMIQPEQGGRRLAALQAVSKKYGFGVGQNPGNGGMMAGGQTIM